MHVVQVDSDFLLVLIGMLLMDYKSGGGGAVYARVWS